MIPFLSFGQEFQSNLPIVVINTNNNTIVDNPRIISDMGIIYNYDQLNSLSNQHNNYHGKISIEIRGSSSQDVFPKKSYSLETQTLTGDNNNVSLLGLPEENDWILHGPYSDKTLLRNHLTYTLSREMGHYAPKAKYCELFINDEYQGVYMLTEKIKRDKNRVNISEFENDDPIEGGYIIKIDKLTEASIDASWCSNFLTFGNNSICFQYHYPKADDISIEQRNYIENYMDEINLLISELSINQTNINLIEKIDFISFIDYLIISELSKDVDAYRISVFLHKDSDANNGKLNMGPVWDYNLSFGNVDFCQSSNISGWVLEEETACRTSIPSFWYDLLYNESFREKLIFRWGELRNNVLSFDNIFHHIDSVGSYLDDAQNRNFEKWNILGEWVWPNYQLAPTYQDELDFLKYWIYNRISWIDQNIDNLRLLFPDCLSDEKKLIQITNQLGQVIEEIDGELLFYIYDNGCVEKKIVTY
tara:strand:- start:3808 stop:5235 length:1428 start_codon:yes stop_codon:yes gene_type:complete